MYVIILSKLSQQIFCIEKSTQENQHKLAGLYSEIELLVKDGKSNTQSQQEICDEISIIHKKVSELSKDDSELLPIRNQSRVNFCTGKRTGATARSWHVKLQRGLCDVACQLLAVALFLMLLFLIHNPALSLGLINLTLQEVDGNSDHSRNTKLGEMMVIMPLLVTLTATANPARNPKQAREQANFMDMQNNNFTAALESMKDWVLDTQEKQIQLIFEMAMRNSGKLVKQRNELKLQIELVSCSLSMQHGLVICQPFFSCICQHIDRDVTSQEVARLSAYKAENQNSMRLMAERCEKSLETQQHHFSAALTAQNRELQPVIEQTHQNTSELAEQRREVTSLYNMKAMMERKMESLENADREIGAGLQKANSAINSLMQENQLITQRNECQTFSLSAPSKRRRAGRKHAGELAPKLEATKPHQDGTLWKQTTKTLAQRIVDPKDKVVRKLASRITDTLVADISNIGAIEDKAGA
ncbi:hypothetical protein PSTG_01687 [Puccinia striiformis f. sp. tritici PST-78]|uniref:Uncharacterized protein n=1 Tax=Puccinia striiformis f. sp. tritici PST-78 TaxID=1165861 RepID=A0A0L0W0S3_9BASI|nr:hypothetical protein PSTG_01687 [Puccinia striiformis f. sp. tritici PST-78]